MWFLKAEKQYLRGIRLFSNPEKTLLKHNHTRPTTVLRHSSSSFGPTGKLSQFWLTMRTFWYGRMPLLLCHLETLLRKCPINSSCFQLCTSLSLSLSFCLSVCLSVCLSPPPTLPLLWLYSFSCLVRQLVHKQMLTAFEHQEQVPLWDGKKLWVVVVVTNICTSCSHNLQPPKTLVGMKMPPLTTVLELNCQQQVTSPTLKVFSLSLSLSLSPLCQHGPQ